MKKVARARLKVGDVVVVSNTGRWPYWPEGTVGTLLDYDSRDGTWHVNRDGYGERKWIPRADLELQKDEAELDREFMELMGIKPVKKKVHNCPDCTHEVP